MFRIAIISLIALLSPLLAAADGPNMKWPECYCTDQTGARVELGETICLTVDHRSYLARCQMVLNNPAWHEVAASCTVSLRDESDQGGAPDALTLQSTQG